jgi:hypothetical protein
MVENRAFSDRLFAFEFYAYHLNVWVELRLTSEVTYYGKDLHRLRLDLYRR